MNCGLCGLPKDTGAIGSVLPQCICHWKHTPYTNPAQELNVGGEPVKNATYWKRQYNEMSALNDRLKSSLYHANEQIKYLELHPAKTLTDEEIMAIVEESYMPQGLDKSRYTGFARAILRKAQEK